MDCGRPRVVIAFRGDKVVSVISNISDRLEVVITEETVGKTGVLLSVTDTPFTASYNPGTVETIWKVAEGITTEEPGRPE
jgi:hypothetical protein